MISYHTESVSECFVYEESDISELSFPVPGSGYNGLSETNLDMIHISAPVQAQSVIHTGSGPREHLYLGEVCLSVEEVRAMARKHRIVELQHERKLGCLIFSVDYNFYIIDILYISGFASVVHNHPFYGSIRKGVECKTLEDLELLFQFINNIIPSHKDVEQLCSKCQQQLVSEQEQEGTGSAEAYGSADILNIDTIRVVAEETGFAEQLHNVSVGVIKFREIQQPHNNTTHLNSSSNNSSIVAVYYQRGNVVVYTDDKTIQQTDVVTVAALRMLLNSIRVGDPPVPKTRPASPAGPAEFASSSSSLATLASVTDANKSTPKGSSKAAAGVAAAMTPVTTPSTQLTAATGSSKGSRPSSATLAGAASGRATGGTSQTYTPPSLLIPPPATPPYTPYHLPYPYAPGITIQPPLYCWTAEKEVMVHGYAAHQGAAAAAAAPYYYAPWQHSKAPPQVRKPPLSFTRQRNKVAAVAAATTAAVQQQQQGVGEANGADADAADAADAAAADEGNNLSQNKARRNKRLKNATVVK